MRRALAAAALAASLTACGGQAEATPRATAAPRIVGHCQMGHAVADGNGDPTGFDPHGAGNGGYAYRLTLANRGRSTVELNGFAVVLYIADGSEAGSDQQSVGDTFLTPGQSLSWLEWTPQASGTSSEGTTGAATCRLVQWTHP